MNWPGFIDSVPEIPHDFNPFTPKFKKYILPNLLGEMYKGGSQNW